MLGDKRGKSSPLRGYDARALSDATAVRGRDEGLVQQQFANEVDINTIMKRFGINGSMPFGNAQGVYGDFSGIESYEDALRKIEEADRKFMSLPPDVRERFNNDPAELIQKAQAMELDEFQLLFQDETKEPRAAP